MMKDALESAIPPQEADTASRMESGPVRKSGLSEEIGFALRFAQLAVFKDLVATYRPFDLRPGQYAALKIIQTNPGLRQGQLGELLCIQKTNLVALICEFERRGLVTKERKEADGRLRALTLTPAGLALMGRVEAAHDLHRARLAALIDDSEKVVLLRLLDKLAGLDTGDDMSTTE
jgi:DNA-binding MarR family transcriptional regulator